LVTTYGYCTSGSTQPISGTTSDGTCTWTDDGTTNAFPQEVVSTGTTGQYPAGTGTPNGVYNVNSTTCGTGSTLCTLAQVGAGYPIGFEWPWVYWHNLIDANAIQHYAAVSWVSQIDYIRFGILGGGEIDTPGYANIASAFSLTPQQYIYMLAQAAGVMYTANNAQMASVTASFVGMAALGEYETNCTGSYCSLLPQLIASSVMTLPYYNSIGNEGLEAADLTSWASGNSPITSNNFIAESQQYWPLAKYLEQQQLKESTGPNASGCSSEQTNTGPLPPLYVFATQHHTNVLEPYASDLLATYASGYYPSTGSGSGFTYGSGCSPYPTAYNSSITNAALGVPNLTSLLGGNAKQLGTSARQ